MKNLRLLLPLLLVTFFTTFSIVSADTYDSDQATIQQVNATTAKVLIESKSYVVPINFVDGAGWGSIKKHYDLDPSVISGLEANKLTISISPDGPLLSPQ